MNIISCKDIVKKYGDYTALDHLSLDIREGSIFGLLGPNGAGKTTLIRIINQIILADSGTVDFYGKRMERNDVYKIGYLPEERGLYKKMKVGEQAVYLARLKGLSYSEAMSALKEWFVRFKIQGWWNKKVSDLSKGMAQKVQFIITVVHNPKLLILDEPFSGFDPVNVQLIRDEILRMKSEGSTIILSTHNMESVEAMCDDIALINKSKLIVTGGVEDVRRKYGKNQVEVIYRSDNPVHVETGFARTAADEEYKGKRRMILDIEGGAKAPDILGGIAAAGLDVVSYRELIPSMNDIFIKLVKGEER